IDQEIAESLKRILDHCNNNSVPIDKFNLHTAFSEVILNAWNHGNRKDPAKPIRVRWWLSNDLNIEITDQGTGFVFATDENPRRKTNLTKESGRGIFLVKKICDSARWFDGGNRVIISFNSNSCSWGQRPQKTKTSSFKLW
nr:ATP-binding protein [Desulfobulbaceae bacterium]